MTEIVRQSPVVSDDRHLLVSTVKHGFRDYSTTVFDESPDRSAAGQHLGSHEHEGRTFGPYVIDHSNERATTRKQALEQHREALYAARAEPIRDLA